jgi:hypothetical protein
MKICYENKYLSDKNNKILMAYSGIEFLFHINTISSSKKIVSQNKSISLQIKG